MKAMIKRGKYAGLILEVRQWCNDWFTLEPGEDTNLSETERIKIMTKPFSPSSLFFTSKGMQEILENKNNGMLLAWFKPNFNKGRFILVQGEGLFSNSFEKIKNNN